MDSKTKLRVVNGLTLARFPLVLLFFVGALVNSWVRMDWLFWSSLAVLILSAMTDLFDGYLARRFDVCTDFGAHADPLMDKFFYLATMPLLVFLAVRNIATGASLDPHPMPHAVVLLVMTVSFLARDQWVTFLRAIGSMYNVSGKAGWAGKVRTALNFPLLCAIYVFLDSPVRFLPTWLIYVGEALGFAINLISAWIYTKQYLPYLRKAATPKSAE